MVRAALSVEGERKDRRQEIVKGCSSQMTGAEACIAEEQLLAQVKPDEQREARL